MVCYAYVLCSGLHCWACLGCVFCVLSVPRSMSGFCACVVWGSECTVGSMPGKVLCFVGVMNRCCVLEVIIKWLSLCGNEYKVFSVLESLVVCGRGQWCPKFWGDVAVFVGCEDGLL